MDSDQPRDAAIGARGPNTHRMDAPSDVTEWTVVHTVRNVVTDDGRNMTLRDEWWEVPSFVAVALTSTATPEPLDGHEPWCYPWTHEHRDHGDTPCYDKDGHTGRESQPEGVYVTAAQLEPLIDEVYQRGLDAPEAAAAIIAALRP